MICRSCLVYEGVAGSDGSFGVEGRLELDMTCSPTIRLPRNIHPCGLGGFKASSAVAFMVNRSAFLDRSI